MLTWLRRIVKVKNTVKLDKNKDKVCKYHYIFHIPETGVEHTICLSKVDNRLFRVITCDCNEKVKKHRCNYYSSRDIMLDREINLYRCACSVNDKYNCLAEMFDD